MYGHGITGVSTGVMCGTYLTRVGESSFLEMDAASSLSPSAIAGSSTATSRASAVFMTG